MGLSDQIHKIKMRREYRNLWHTDLCSAVVADCPFCCFAFFCGPCASYILRKRALYNNMSSYVCCAGYSPCSGRCGERKCPEFCLCTEVFCCFANSVASTRFLLQDTYNIQTTECDNCILGFMICLQQLACICSLLACIIGNDDIAELANMLSCLSDMVFCSVCPCMQTQHKVEIDKRDGMLGPRRVMEVPPQQQMSRFDQPIPPSVAYPPQQSYMQAYGQPPPIQCQSYLPGGYYPPHPAQGYSPSPPRGQGYPPSAPTGYSSPAQGQGHPPAQYPQAHGYPPAGYPAPAYLQSPPPEKPK